MEPVHDSDEYESTEEEVEGCYARILKNDDYNYIWFGISLENLTIPPPGEEVCAITDERSNYTHEKHKAMLQYSDLGFVALLEEKWDEAIILYTMALSLHKSHTNLYHNRSFAYEQVGKYEEALKDASKILNYGFYSRMGKISTFFCLKDALEYYNKGLQIREYEGESVREFCDNLKEVVLLTKDRLEYFLHSRLENNRRTGWDNTDPIDYDDIEKFIYNLFSDSCQDYKLFKESYFENKSALSAVFSIILDPLGAPELELTHIIISLYMVVCAYLKLKEYQKCIELSAKLLQVARENQLGLKNMNKIFDIMSKAIVRMLNGQQGKSYNNIFMMIERITEVKIPFNKEQFLKDVVDIITVGAVYPEENLLITLKGEDSNRDEARVLEPYTVAMLKDERDFQLDTMKLLYTIQIFTKAVDNDHDEELNYYNRSLAYMRAFIYEEAIQDAEKVIALKPNWSEGYFQKGNALYFQSPINNILEATECYEKGLEIDPHRKDIERILVDLKIAFKVGKQVKEALAKLRKGSNETIFGDPLFWSLIRDFFYANIVDTLINPLMKTILDVVYGSKGSEKEEEASRAPENITYILGIAATHFSRKNYQRGIELCEKGIQICRDKKMEWENISRALRLIGDGYEIIGDHRQKEFYYRKSEYERRNKN